MKKSLILNFLLLISFAVSAQQTQLLTDFEGTNQLTHPFDGYVYGYTDSLDGGRSTINEMSGNVLQITTLYNKGANSSSGYLKITGNVTTDFIHGFAGCGFNFKANKGTVDLTKYKGIKFSIKTYGKYFVTKIESPKVSDKAFHEQKIISGDNWTEITLLFNSFSQPSWAKQRINLNDILTAVKGIQFQTVGQPITNFKLEIDNIELIK